jgi:hypothetical protein
MIRLFITGTPENLMLIMTLVMATLMFTILGFIKLFEKFELFGFKKKKEDSFTICLNGKNYTIDPESDIWVVDQMAAQDAARERKEV